MNTIDAQYQALLQDILDNGVQKGDRTDDVTFKTKRKKKKKER